MQLNIQQAIEVSNQPQRCIDFMLKHALRTLQMAIYNTERETPDYETINAAYIRVSQNYEQRFPQAHCGATDPDLYEVYHNVYKSDHGFRPRGYITGPEVRAWLAHRETLPQCSHCGQLYPYESGLCGDCEDGAYEQQMLDRAGWR